MGAKVDYIHIAPTGSASRKDNPEQRNRDSQNWNNLLEATENVSKVADHDFYN